MTPVGPWDSFREGPATSASWMLLFGGSIHCLHGPSAPLFYEGFCGAEYLAFLRGLSRDKA